MLSADPLQTLSESHVQELVVHLCRTLRRPELDINSNPDSPSLLGLVLLVTGSGLTHPLEAFKGADAPFRSFLAKRSCPLVFLVVEERAT
jgi:hypothetical protein